MSASRQNIAALAGRSIGPIEHRWSAREAILYALSGGASQDDIAFVFEGYGPQLLPTFAVFAAGPWTPALTQILPAGVTPVGLRENPVIVTVTTKGGEEEPEAAAGTATAAAAPAAAPAPAAKAPAPAAKK